MGILFVLIYTTKYRNDAYRYVFTAMHDAMRIIIQQSELKSYKLYKIDTDKNIMSIIAQEDFSE